MRSVLPGRIADEHVVQHLLGHRRGCVSTRCSRCRTRPCRPRRRACCARTILSSLPSRVFDDVQCDMGIGRLHVVAEFDVVELGAADHPLLLGDRQRFPTRHVVQVLLHVHIAAAGEIGVLVADLGGADGKRSVRVLGAVDEAEQVAIVEEPEAVHLVDDGDRTGHRLDHLAGQLEAHVEHLGADVEQQIAGGCRGLVAPAVQGDEGMQLGRALARRTTGPTRAEPIEVTIDRRLAGSRNPIARTRPARSGSASWTVASPPGSIVATRKMAAGVNGASTGCGSGVGTVRP